MSLINNYRQYHPELVVQDCRKLFGLSEEQAEQMRKILLLRGINKWLYARRLFIGLKHKVKEKLKQSKVKSKEYYLLQWINTEMQYIAKLPRWIKWGKRVHHTMKNNEKEVVIK